MGEGADDLVAVVVVVAEYYEYEVRPAKKL